MVFRFLMLSDEVDDFKREIQIDSDATFLDLQKAILTSVDYQDGDISSFYICDDDWGKKTEITLMEMDTSSDEDSYIMSESVLNDFLEDEKQKLMYVFDFITERSFFIELREIITGKNLEDAVCTKSQGQAPLQYVDIKETEIAITKVATKTIDLEETFYGDEGYDMDELDTEGFDGLDNDVPLPDDESI